MFSNRIPTCRGRVIDVSHDKITATILTVTGRKVELARGNGQWVGLCVGQMVEIQHYDRNAVLFGLWIVIEEPPAMPLPRVEAPPVRRELSAPARPPMPDPKRIRAERFAVAPSNVPWRDLNAERAEMIASRRGFREED